MRILYHGDSPTVATGFGNVSRNLLSGLAKEHEITVIGINDRGGYKDPKEYPYRIYPAIYNDFRDVLGIKRLINVLVGQDPEIKGDFDCLFLQYDFTLLAESYIGSDNLFSTLKQIVKPTVKKIIYTPIDNGLVTPKWREVLEWFDIVIVPSQYGFKVLEGVWGTKKAKEKVKVVYYGVENTFKPLVSQERLLIRKRMTDALKKQNIEVEMENKYIIGFVGRNQWRKDIYRTVKIFTEFKKQHPNAYLYLHTDPLDNNHDGGNLLDLLSYYGQFYGKDYLVPLGLNSNTGIARVDMNEIYNMLDVYLSSSVGEGFGLPILEAMKCRVPVIAPNNTTMPELLDDDRGSLYDTDNTVCFGQLDFMRERELGDIKDAVLTLTAVHALGEKLSKNLTKAQEFADKYTPELMAKEVGKLL